MSAGRVVPPVRCHSGRAVKAVIKAQFTCLAEGGVISFEAESIVHHLDEA